MSLTEGSKAPGWTGSDQHGALRSSQDYLGKWVLLYFYPKDDTPGCTTEACGFRDAFEELRKHVEVVGISADDTTSHKAFADKYRLPFTLIADPSSIIITAYGTDNAVFKKRTSFLINPDGVIQKIYENIDVEHHAKDVLNFVRQLSTGKT